jgi:hypothetical protein
MGRFATQTIHLLDGRIVDGEAHEAVPDTLDTPGSLSA